jgi:hypothetical protein
MPPLRQSTLLQLPRVMKNSGLLYLLVMNVGNEWADVASAVVDGLIDKVLSWSFE